MTLLTRDQILTAQDLRRKTILVPEWGGDVIIRELMAVERDDLETHFLAERAKSKDGVEAVRNFRARTLAICLIDEDGRSLFTTADIDDLGKKNAAVVSRLFAVLEELSGLSENALEATAKK